MCEDDASAVCGTISHVVWETPSGNSIKHHSLTNSLSLSPPLSLSLSPSLPPSIPRSIPPSLLLSLPVSAATCVSYEEEDTCVCVWSLPICTCVPPSLLPSLLPPLPLDLYPNTIQYIFHSLIRQNAIQQLWSYSSEKYIIRPSLTSQIASTMLQHLDKNVTPSEDMDDLGAAGTGVRPTFQAPTVGTLAIHEVSHLS